MAQMSLSNDSSHETKKKCSHQEEKNNRPEKKPRFNIPLEPSPPRALTKDKIRKRNAIMERQRSLRTFGGTRWKKNTE
ncbi:unnamed protein product [Pylaiella littoralis]